jgi:hypothetical protein
MGWWQRGLRCLHECRGRRNRLTGRLVRRRINLVRRIPRFISFARLISFFKKKSKIAILIITKKSELTG